MITYQDALNSIIWRLTSHEEDLELRETDKEDIAILQKLVDKETPKTLVRYNHSNEWHCPTCGSGNGEYEGTVGTHNYCHYCGQKLNWR